MSESSRTVPDSAYSVLAPGHYQSSLLTRGPWHPDHQHGGPPIALVCSAIEAHARAHGLGHIARITANLIRPVPIGELTVEVHTDYAGRNAAHYSARLLSGARELGRFTALAQRENDVTLPTSALEVTVPPPAGVEDSPESTMPFAGAQVGYADLVETRTARGRLFAGPCAVWFRMRYPLIAGEPTSAYQRVAVAADSGNGISAMLDFRRFSFVNSDLTINLLRQPVGEWIALDARTYLGTHGGGLAESALFDVDGLVGRATQSLAVRARDSADTA